MDVLSVRIVMQKGYMIQKKISNIIRGKPKILPI